MKGTLARYACYSVALLGAAALLLRVVMIEDTIEQLTFRERGLVEWAQVVVLMGAVMVLWFGGYAWVASRTTLWALALTGFIGVIRELDWLLDAWVPVLGWKLPAGVVVCGLVMLVARRREVFAAERVRWVNSGAFAIMWSGFITVVVFAQLLGQAELWEGVMGDAYERAFKRTVEESIELFGCSLILVGAVEACFTAVWWERALRPDR